MKVSDLRLSHLLGAVTVAVLGAVLLFRPSWTAGAAGAADPASGVAVNCEVGQQALVRQTVVNGEPRVAIQCAGPALAQQIAYAESYGGAMPIGAPAMTPAVAYAQPGVVEYPVRSAPVTTRRVASRTTQDGRSWKKTALIIGGSGGAGAGIGALIGGKKGALIGAALGGGTAGIYEAVKR